MATTAATKFPDFLQVVVLEPHGGYDNRTGDAVATWTTAGLVKLR